MRSLPLLALLLASVASAQPDPGVDLPEPPAGFSWQVLPEEKGAFLLPDQWHYAERGQSGTRGYFLTEQDVAASGRFTTGLSINAVPDIPGKAGVSAPQYAEALAGAVSDVPGAEVQRRWDGVQGPLSFFGVRYRSVKPDGAAVVLHQVTVGNERTGTLYVLLFEAPEAEWESAWTKGEPMMSTFVLDQSI